MRLVAENLSVTLGARQVLSEARLSLAPGEVVGLLGPNGAGKSTLMRALARLVAHEGIVRLGERTTAELSAGELARLLAFLPQARAVAWSLSVRNLVGLGRLPWRGFARGMSARDEEIVSEAMALMDVAHLAERPATELSGGEQARVLAARAVAQDTPFLIADEPASGLDPAHQMTMMQAFRQRAAGDGRAILVSLHDLTLAARWCDRVLLMKEGRIAASGPPGDILTAERLRAVFGISAHIARDAEGLILAPVALAPEQRG